MNIVFISGIILSFFQLILLLNKRNKGVPDKILALGMCAIGIHLLGFHLYHLGYWNTHTWLIGLTVPFPLLYGPVIFIYTQYSLKPETRLNKIDYLHFAPALFSYLYMFKFYFFYTGEEKLKVINGEVNDYSVFTSLLLVAFIISGLSYSVLAHLKLKTHKRMIDNNFSCDEQISLNWLKYSIWATGAIFLSIAVIITVRDWLGFQFSFNADLIFYTLIVILIFCIGFFGIQHQNLFSNINESNQGKLVRNPSPGEYRKSGLREEAAVEIHRRLLELMEKEKPYLNPRLTLINLAELLDVTTNHLSQTINQYEKVNFHDFVNKFRVDEFIGRAGEKSNFSILANALDSGFNSKSSFNTVFKKFKGITPSKYMDSLNR